MNLFDSSCATFGGLWLRLDPFSSTSPGRYRGAPLGLHDFRRPGLQDRVGVIAPEVGQERVTGRRSGFGQVERSSAQDGGILLDARCQSAEQAVSSSAKPTIGIAKAKIRTLPTTSAGCAPLDLTRMSPQSR
jgi:hypothetical protein